MPRVLAATTPSGALNEEAIREAARLLRSGGLVAIPTETVYGLAANALDPVAIRGIFAAKGRPAFNPLIVHVSGVAAARTLAAAWPRAAEALAHAFWPGPLSIVVPKVARVPAEVSAGLPSVALRAPAHPVTRALLEEVGLPLAAPSANRSNAVSPTMAAHVISSLGDRIDAVLDGGTCAVGIESTVVDVTGERPVILRPGGISAAAIEEVAGQLGARPRPAEDAGRASPGMLARHYAPDAITTLFDLESVEASLTALPPTARVGGIVRTAPRPTDPRIVAWERLGSDPVEFARQLYAALHRVESSGATHVFLERVPSTSDWEAIADRLTRAAGPAKERSGSSPTPHE